MALEVSIEHAQNVMTGGRVTLRAVVTDSITNNVITGSSLTYAWSLDGAGTLEGITTNPTVSYWANNISDDVATTVHITCAVSRLNRNPVPSTVDLDTFSALGIDGVDANMLIVINETGDAWFDRDDDDAFLPVTDRTLVRGLDINSDLVPLLDIGWIIYNETNGEFTINRVQSGTGATNTMSSYWGDPLDTSSNLNTKAPYIILRDGTIVQFQTGWFDNAGGGFVRWIINTTEAGLTARAQMARVTEYDFVLVGIGDAGTLDVVIERARQTVTVSVIGTVSIATSVFNRTLIKPIIDKINVGFLSRLVGNTVFNKLEGIDNKPRAAYGKVGIQIPYYDTTIDQQRYRPVKFGPIQISTRIDGVSEFEDTEYIVILQIVGDNATGISGRSFPVFGVYDKTLTTFSIAYEEGITSAAFGSMLTGVSAELLWFARG